MVDIEKAFTGRVAMITGASRGIGRAVSLAYAAAGGDVALVARDRDRLNGVMLEAKERGVRAEAFDHDLTRGEMGLLSRQMERTFGRLDVVVHAAGVYATGPQVGDEGVDLLPLWRTNLEAPLLLSLACRDLLRTHSGDIVFINSSIVGSSAPGLPAYAATKRALSGLADSLRATFNPDGIRVLSIFPGRTATAMQEQIFKGEGRTYHPERLLQPEHVAAVVVHALGLPRTAEVTDVHIRPFRKPGS